MKVAAESDNGGMSDTTDTDTTSMTTLTTTSSSSSSIHVQETEERITFKAMDPKSPDKDCKLHEHQRRPLPIVRPPPKPTPEFDELFQNVILRSDPIDQEDESCSSCKTSDTECDSDSVSSWSSGISVMKTGATYSRTRPKRIICPSPSKWINEGDQRTLQIPELEIDFTDEDMKRVKCFRFFPIGYADTEPLYFAIERTPKPEPRNHPPKMHELSDDWQRFEVDLPEYSSQREYIHDKRLRLLTLGLQPPRRFIGNENNFNLHAFLIAQAQFLMDMPGYDPETEFPLHKIFDLRTMKYKPRPGSITPKIDVGDDSSPVNVQDSMDTKDDTTLLTLQSSQTEEDSRFLDHFMKEEPKSDVPNDEDNESEEADVENAEQDGDDSQNSDDEADMEEDVENSEQDDKSDVENSEQDDKSDVENSEQEESDEDMENSEKDDKSDVENSEQGDGDTRIAESSETESDNESGDDSESAMDSDDMDEDL